METPVEKRPLEATAREPPRSTGERETLMFWGAMVGLIRWSYPCWLWCRRGGYQGGSRQGWLVGGLWRGRGDWFGGEETYGVLFLHGEFEINGAASRIGYSELWKRWISYCNEIELIKMLEGILNTFVYCRP